MLIQLRTVLLKWNEKKYKYTDALISRMFGGIYAPV